MRLVRYAYGIGSDGPAGRTGVRGGSNPWAPARVRGPTGTGTAWRTIAIRSRDGEDRLSADLSRVAGAANGKEGLDERDKTCSRFDEVDKKGMEVWTGETLCLRLAASWGWSVTTVPEVCDRSSREETEGAAGDGRRKRYQSFIYQLEGVDRNWLLGCGRRTRN